MLKGCCEECGDEAEEEEIMSFSGLERFRIVAAAAAASIAAGLNRLRNGNGAGDACVCLCTSERTIMLRGGGGIDCEGGVSSIAATAELINE